MADPRFALAVAHQRAGRSTDAVVLCTQILTSDPNNFDTLFMLAGIAHAAGRYAEAISWLSRCLKIAPGNANVHLNLGDALTRAGRPEDALSVYEHALRSHPANPDLHNNFGNLLLATGKPADAAEHLRQAVRLDGNLAEAHYNLGRAFHAMNQLDQATQAYEQSLRLRPTLAQAHYNLGVIAQARDEAARARVYYESALRLRPDYLLALSNLGAACLRLRDYDAARQALERAIELKPDYATALGNLAAVASHTGQNEHAVQLCRRAVDLAPSSHAIHSQLILLMHRDPQSDGQAISLELRRWNERHGAPLANAFPPPSNDPSPSRRLRLGIVSGELYDRVIAWLTLPWLRRLAPADFQLFFYHNAHRSDAKTAEFAALGEFRCIAGVSDDAVAAMIRSDGVDVLLDLNVHTAGNRLLVFARRPAPVLMTYIGCPGSSGLAVMDYRITDAFMEPPGMFESMFPERPLRLPHCYWCYEPQPGDPQVADLPATRNGIVTFGCLHELQKLNDRTLSLFAGVLQAVADSRLVILAVDGSHRRRIVEFFGARSIATGRIAFVPPAPRARYMTYYNQIDIHLDAYPYTAHSTALDSLWMGVPIVTLAGQTPVSRGAYTCLSHVGLARLVTSSDEQYAATARQLAGDIPALGELRRTLRGRMADSPIMDLDGFARSIQSLFRNAWVAWCEGQRR